MSASAAAASLSSDIFGVEDFPVLDDLIDIPEEDYPLQFSDSSAIINPQHVSPWDEFFPADMVSWPVDASNRSSEVINGEDDATCQNSSSRRKARSKRTKRRACELVQNYWGRSHGDTTINNNDEDDDEDFELDDTSSTYDTSSTPSLSSTSQSSPKEVHHFPTFSDEAHRLPSSSDDDDITTNNHRVKVMRLPTKTKQSKKQKQEHRVCSHCGSQSTPQWREGPLGPKTLCNACGVRYKSGRLLPEYRPAASPTFNAGIHSNSHRRVLEMHMINSTGHARTGAKSTPHQSLVC